MKGLGKRYLACMLTAEWVANALSRLEVTDDYVALTNRSISEKEYNRILHALWPQSIATSLYVSYRTFCSLQYARLKQFLNIKSENGSPAGQVNRPAGGFSQLPSVDQKEDSRGINVGLGRMADPKSTDSKSADVTHPNSTAKSPPGTSTDKSRISSSLPSIPPVTGDLATATAVFKQTLGRTWLPPMTIERGQITISGLIELEGSRATAIYDVLALYDPNKSSLVGIHVRPRRTTMKRLAPLGGR